MQMFMFETDDDSDSEPGYLIHHAPPVLVVPEFRVLNLQIARTWFDLAATGLRTEDARRVCRYYTPRLAGREWDLIKFTNGYHADAPVLFVRWLSTHVVPSYQVVAPNGTVYASTEPHYVISFESL